MKVALVYDRVNKWGGGERVLLALHQLFPKAPLFTSVYDKKSAPWASVFDVKASFLQNFPFAATHHEFYALLMPMAFESFDLSSYDLVISVTSESAKGVITASKTKHICYILTPTRYLWSGYETYFKNTLFRTIAFPAIWYLKRWDMVSSQRPDAYIAISQEVRERVKKYYNRDASVVYPSCTIADSYSPNKLSGYFLIVSRLVPYKKIDLAIKTCNRLKLPLLIIGTGSEEKYLKQIAGPTVQFLGTLTDEEVVGYYKNCRALIFPGEEDFGLTIIEAQKFGKPVVAYKSGGAKETIIEGKTGEFFYPQTVRALQKALENFDESRYSAIKCRQQADTFSVKNFRKNFLRTLKNLDINI